MRRFLYHLYTGVSFAVVGLLSSVILGNALAIVGWVAALASALRVVEHVP